MDKTIGVICLITFITVMLIIGVSDNGTHSMLAFIGLILGLAVVYFYEREHDDR